MGWSKVWKVRTLKYSTVEQLSPFFHRNCWNHPVRPCGILFPSCQRQIGWEIKQEKYTQPTLSRAVSTQHLLYCRVFQVIYFCDFLPEKKSVSVKCCCFSSWPCDAALSEDAEMHCSYSGLWIYVLFPDAEESTGLNDEQTASAALPIKKLIVCPSRKGNDLLGFSLHISSTHSSSNPTAFDFVCVHTERLRFVSVGSPCLCQF